MANIYGNLVVHCDFSGDKHKVMTILNRFIWNEDLEPYYLDNDGDICMSEHQQSPTIFPSVKDFYDDEGELVEIDLTSSDAEINEDWEIEPGERVSLETMVNLISPLLGDGQITIAVNSAMRAFSIGYGELTIRSNHTGTQRYISTSTAEGSGESVYQYP